MRFLFFLLLILSSKLFSAPVDRVWDGGGADNKLSTPANWVGNIAPNAGDSLVFTGAVNTTIVNDYANGTSFAAIKLIGTWGNAANYTLSGNSIVLTGGVRAIVNSSGTAGAGGGGYHLLLSNNIRFSVPSTIWITVTGNSKITLSGAIDNGGNAITINNTGNASNMFLTGVISGSGSLIFSGAAVTAVSGTNTYTGGTVINSGTVNVSNASAFGSVSGTVTVNGGSFRSDNVLTLLNYPMTWAGSFGYWGGNNLHLGYGPVTMTGDIVIDVASPLTLTVGGVISGNYNVTKTNAGTLAFLGANTYGKTTTVSAGTLRVGSSSALGSTALGTVVSSGAVLDLYGQDYTSNEPLSIIGTGISSSGAVMNSSTTAGSYAGLVTLTGSASIIAGSGNISLTNTGTISGNTFILTVGGSSNGSIASIIGTTSGGVIKQDAGSWTLSGSNTYTGVTTISAGTLKINNSQALGTTANGTTVASGGVLDLNGITYSLSEPLTVNGYGISSAGAVINSNSISAVFPGLVTLGSASSVIAGSGNISITNAGTITGAFNLTLGGAKDIVVSSIVGTAAGEIIKQDAGVVSLNGANTYTGATTISGGTLKLGNAQALGTVANGTTVALGAVLDLNGITYSLSEALTVNGTGIANAGAIVNNNTTAASFPGLITLGSAASIIASTGNISITNAGTITGAYSLTLGGAKDIVINSIIGTSTGGIDKQDAGTCTLNGANTYSGATSINAGVIKIGNATALGATTNGTTLVSGAALDCNGISYSLAEAISIIGTDVANSGAMYNSSATAASLPGSITLLGASTIKTDNQITLSGSVLNSQDLTKTGSSNLVFTSNTAAINTLTISAGNLAAGSSTINLTGNFNNNATFTPSTSLVRMCGTSSQTISAAGFYNVTIDNASGVSLIGNITVSNTLLLLSGVLSTGAFKIDLGTTGTLAETTPNAYAPTSYVTGTVAVTRTLMQNVQNSFGGIGIDLLEANCNNNVTQITRVTGTACPDSINNHYSIKRYFTINPTTDIGLNGTMVFHYFDHEIIGHTEANLKIYKSTNNRVSWMWQLASTVTPASNFISLSSITSFSDWTGSDVVFNNLPISLIDFSAVKCDSGVCVNWKTASERDNKQFDLQRSVNGIDWSTVYSCAGAGTSLLLNRYQFVDSDLPVAPILYYRLVQVDFDATKSTSKVLSIALKIPKTTVTIKPVPSTADNVDIIVFSSINQNSVIEIFDMYGRLVLHADVRLSIGTNVFSLADLCQLSKGEYWVKLTSASIDVNRCILVQ